ncbi:MAG: type II toxin-antitoxin system VapC family toxin [Hormoscilla sp. SP5CHS1]|nr:type II toxin-antitoxin system VapC family toxin [Hormoscilla sp. SP12CHS1]MBC6453560.1 type II toxin-antitoxin system VapC family toxin [Hormoscilla sp. SP5CHS1]
MLLDTHILLWFLDDSPRLPQKVREQIEDADRLAVSIVTLWEIAIKLSIKKLELQFEFQELPAFLDQLGIEVIPITFADVQCYVTLPLHHRDPFDRLLVAQGMNRSLSLVSADTKFDPYAISRVWE